MKIKVTWVGKTKKPAIQALTEEYLTRIGRYAQVEGVALKDESGLCKQRGSERISQFTVLFDSRGRQLSSQEFAGFIEQHQGSSSLPLLFAIGPASGFSRETLNCANLLLSLGKMTYAHEIARLLVLEQIYRAFTIIKRHPYHLGH